MEPRDRHEDETAASPAPQAEHDSPAIPQSSDFRPLVDPVAVFTGILRSGRLIAICAIVGAAIGIVVALSTPRSYYAVAELLVDPREWAVMDRDANRGGMQADAVLAMIENQARVLVSRPVLEETVERLNLNDDPEFNGQESAGLSPFALIGSLRQLVSLSGSGSGVADRRQVLAVRNLREALSVDRAGRTYIVNVGVTSRNPEKAALIVNTLTEVYLDTSARILASSTGRAADELAARLDELRVGVEQAERAVETFKAENEIIDAQGRLITDDEITRLNDQLSQARARTFELNARAASARNLDVRTVVTGSLPEQLASPSMTELRAQFNNMRLTADRLAVRLGPRHPERLAAQAQVEGAAAQIETELSRIVESLQVDLRRAVQQEEELAAELARLKIRQGDLGNELVTLRELEREASAKRAVYEAFLLRARETGEQRQLNTANISIISEATPPLETSGLSRAAISAGGLVLGLLFGVGIAGARGAYLGLRRAGARAEPSEPDGSGSKTSRTNRGEQHADVAISADPAERREGSKPSHAHGGGRRAATAEVGEQDGFVGAGNLDDIRTSLRECRAAIDDLMRQRPPPDRFGT